MDLNRYDDYTFLQGKDFTFYISDDEDIYGFDVAKNEKVKLMNYQKEIPYIFGECFPGDNLGAAIMNRLVKAAGYHIEKV